MKHITLKNTGLFLVLLCAAGNSNAATAEDQESPQRRVLVTGGKGAELVDAQGNALVCKEHFMHELTGHSGWTRGTVRAFYEMSSEQRLAYLTANRGLGGVTLGFFDAAVPATQVPVADVAPVVPATQVPVAEAGPEADVAPIVPATQVPVADVAPVVPATQVPVAEAALEADVAPAVPAIQVPVAEAGPEADEAPLLKRSVSGTKNKQKK